jgi:hypothetical protein
MHRCCFQRVCPSFSHFRPPALYVTSEDYYHHSLVIDTSKDYDRNHRPTIVITPEDDYRKSLEITSERHSLVILTPENYSPKSLVAIMTTIMATNYEDIEIGEQTPLFQNDDETPLEDIEHSTRREKAVAGVSAISFGTSFAAMLFEGNLLVYISGLVGIIVAPYATIQQQKITEVDALKETNERGAYTILRTIDGVVSTQTAATNATLSTYLTMVLLSLPI